MSSSEIFNKIFNFLHNSPSDHITAFSVIFQLIEYDTWYLKEELREIIHNVINKVKNLDQQNSEKYLKIIDIPLK
ncbi:17722_t:CDS:1, partial [Funneliformis caledonium]